MKILMIAGSALTLALWMGNMTPAFALEGESVTKSETVTTETAFSGPFFKQEHKTIIHSWFTPEGRRELPPDFVKRIEVKEVPAPVSKVLVRNARVTTEIESELQPVPPTLTTRFGTLPPETKLYMYGHNAILIDEPKKTVIDVISVE
jgi:hypothetical protein